jgi:catechol 2,3-dioxygenase-like lactoylglutathione lyase family enzyme
MEGLRIVEMDHIVLNVRDMDRSLAFYVDTLGLQPERLELYRESKVGFPSVRISAGTLIDLMLVREPTEAEGTAVRHNLNHFCLVTEAVDLEVLANGLEAQGVTIKTRPVSRWGARGQAQSIYVLDPDGNEVEIRCY